MGDCTHCTLLRVLLVPDTRDESTPVFSLVPVIEGLVIVEYELFFLESREITAITAIATVIVVDSIGVVKIMSLNVAIERVFITTRCVILVSEVVELDCGHVLLLPALGTLV